jgi:hypothetical protein
MNIIATKIKDGHKAPPNTKLINGWVKFQQFMETISLSETTSAYPVAVQM